MHPRANNVTMTLCKVATHLWPGTVGQTDHKSHCDLWGHKVGQYDLN